MAETRSNLPPEAQEMFDESNRQMLMMDAENLKKVKEFIDKISTGKTEEELEAKKTEPKEPGEISEVDALKKAIEEEIDQPKVDHKSFWDKIKKLSELPGATFKMIFKQTEEEPMDMDEGPKDDGETTIVKSLSGPEEGEEDKEEED